MKRSFGERPVVGRGEGDEAAPVGESAGPQPQPSSSIELRGGQVPAYAPCGGQPLSCKVHLGSLRIGY